MSASLEWKEVFGQRRLRKELKAAIEELMRTPFAESDAGGLVTFINPTYTERYETVMGLIPKVDWKDYQKEVDRVTDFWRKESGKRHHYHKANAQALLGWIDVLNFKDRMTFAKFCLSLGSLIIASLIIKYWS